MLERVIKFSMERIKNLGGFDINNFNIDFYQFTIDKISFEPFMNPVTRNTKNILEWCNLCGKGSICGRCPSQYNNYNFKNQKKIKEFKRSVRHKKSGTRKRQNYFSG